MKRVTLVFLSVFLFVSGIAQAQIFIGGNLGFSSTGGRVENGSTTTDKTVNSSFSFSPMAGYFLSDKLAVGASLDIASQRQKTPGNPETISTAGSFGLTPFVRYYAFQMNKFSIYGQGYLGVAFGSSQTKSGGTTVHGPKSTSFSLGFFPGVSYDISDKIALEANIRLVNLGYSVSTTKTDVGNTTVKDVTSSFSFGAGLDNIVTTGTITIGAIFKL